MTKAELAIDILIQRRMIVYPHYPPDNGWAVSESQSSLPLAVTQDPISAIIAANDVCKKMIECDECDDCGALYEPNTASCPEFWRGEPLQYDPTAKPIWEEFADVLADVPPGEWAKLPTGGAETHLMASDGASPCLPHGSTLVAHYDSEAGWTGSLSVPGAGEFSGSETAIFRLCCKLDDLYRKGIATGGESG